MGCRSDYMEQSEEEEFMQQTAKLILYVLKKQKIRFGDNNDYDWVKEQALNYYANDRNLEPYLCGLIKKMSDEELDVIMYDGKVPKARQLADWWDQHLEADKKRYEMDMEVERKETLTRMIKERLSAEMLDMIIFK